FYIWNDISGGDYLAFASKVGGPGSMIAFLNDNNSLATLAVDSNAVFFYMPAGGVGYAPKMASGPISPLTSDVNFMDASQLVLGGSYVYIVSVGNIGRVFNCPMAQRVRYVATVQQPTPPRIAVDSNYVYWTGPGLIGRVPLLQ